ncbi:MAG: hypothetical protein ACLFO5_05375, partial [Opitutales bacterium]
MLYQKTLDQKLKRIADGSTDLKDFIIADAKDADMAFGIAAPGPNRAGSCPHGYDPTQKCYKTLEDYLAQVREVVKQQ